MIPADPVHHFTPPTGPTLTAACGAKINGVTSSGWFAQTLLDEASDGVRPCCGVCVNLAKAVA